MERLILYFYRVFSTFLFKKVDCVGELHQGPLVLCINHHMGFADSVVAMQSAKELLRQVLASIVRTI